MPASEFTATLHALHDASVDFILVGGLAAVIEGAPIATFDVDVIHSKEPGNVARVLRAVESLDHAVLHLHETAGRDLSYQDLLPHSTEVDIGGGMRIRVLNLEKLIEIKEALGGEKDRAMLPLLRRVLEEKRKAHQ